MLTTRGLTRLRPGQWASDGGTRGAGMLAARRLATGGIAFYFRYTAPNGRRGAIPLGEYGIHGLSLEAARERAGGLSRRYRSGERDLRAAIAADAAAARQRAAAAHVRTLGALLDAYADQLKRDGKPSAGKVRGALHLHVREASAGLWATSLDAITTDALLAAVAAVADVGHLRQAEKVRAYLRAAFAAGMKARHNAKALPALRDLRITSNPARDLTPIEGANKARDRALSLAELRAYWRRIQVPTLPALRFHLLTGCQRIAQLARATVSDYDADTQSLRLLDGKGRRTTARQHHVPILPDAREAMQAMGPGPFVFSVTHGKSGAEYSTIARRVCVVAAAMLDDEELPGGPFTAGDLRRTVETRLADAGVSRETRGFLQSHGLGGVQARHYDRHDTLPETRAALEVLRGLLDR